MTRSATGPTIAIRPTINIYTALAGVAVLAQIVGLVAVFLAADKIGGLW